MELGAKEKQIALVALHRFMDELKQKMESEEVGEDEYSDYVNDASLLEIVIAKFEQDPD